MRSFTSLLVAILLSILVVGTLPVRGADKNSLEDDILKGADADLKSAAGQGRFVFVIDGADGKPIEGSRFVRGIPGQFSVAEFPRGFSIDGHAMFQAGRRLDSQLGQKGVTIFCQAAPDADGEAARYASRCSANLPSGKYTIEPFGLTFDVGEAIHSSHPALTVAGNVVHIRTAAVTFAAADDKTGASRPLVNLKLLCGKADLLADLLESGDVGGFNPLTLYLPIGTSYQSSLGDFSIDGDGQIHPSPAAAASFAHGAFVARVPAAGKAEVAAPAAVVPGYWFASQNLRRVYKRGEAAPFVVIASGNLPADKLPVIATRAGEKLPLGELSMPGSGAGDSRIFLLNTSALAPGKYQITAANPAAHGFDIEVVDLLPTTPLFLFTMDSCGESDFTLDPAGFDQLRAAGVRCWSKYGFGGALNATGEGKSPYPPAPADAPAELNRPVSNAREMLDESLRHELFTIDFEARRLNWYNEGLAFHHSEPMTVERMIRRVQIFSQELGDYPAFAGMSYTWFPQLGGYTEGGVPTDPFFNTRMQILRENVKRETGFAPLSPAQSQEWTRTVNTEAGVPQAMADARRNFWRAEQHLGWYATFDLYNRKLHEARPDFIATTACNAGHDGGASVADMAAAHDAMTWESYTDFGDWPMSAGFCADWAHGMAPGTPQWQQVESSQAEPAIVAKQFYKLARGVEGIGVGVHGPGGARANARRGKANRFLERYGSLVAGYQPDNTVAVCVNELEDRAEYQAHALQSHLTRLGYGPVILSEETIEQGVPAGVKVILIPNLHVPFSLQFQAKLREFMAGGGKAVEVGEHCLPIDGAVRVEIPLKQLWNLGGFATHLAFWEEFGKVAPVLEKTMAGLGFSPANGAAPEKAVILPMRSAAMRYVAVISSPLSAKDTEFAPVTGVEVKVGAAGRVVNLVTGETLPVAGGKVTVDLVNEPGALLALLDKDLDGIALHYPASAKAGERISFGAEIPSLAAGAGVPVEYVLTDSAGKQRAVFYRLSGTHHDAIHSASAAGSALTDAAGVGGASAVAPASVAGHVTPASAQADVTKGQASAPARGGETAVGGPKPAGPARTEATASAKSDPAKDRGFQGNEVHYDLPATEPAGEFSLRVTELLTGLTAECKVKVGAAPAPAAISQTEPVYLPHPDRLPLFLSRTGEVRVVVEDSQSQDLADAESLADALRKTGRLASVQKVSAGNFDSYKLRWFPTKHETDLLAKIDAGEIVGYRIDLKPYVNTALRKHIPEKGGWADIQPSYVIRNDVILFSGGKIADSLRAVSDWMPTANVPGKGNGIIEVALSPFWADRQAVAIVSNDDAGRARAVDRLIELISVGGKGLAASPFAAPTRVAAEAVAIGSKRVALETPLKGFVPPALAVGLESSPDGFAMVQSRRAAQLISPEGKIVQSLPAGGIPPAIAAGGTIFGAAVTVTRSDPAWHFPTAWKIAVRLADGSDRHDTFDIPGQVDWIGDHFPGWDGGYAVSPDGKTYFAGLAGGGFMLADLPGKTYRVFSRDAKSIGYADAARVPRFVSAAKFSRDGQFVAMTLADHPSGYGGLGAPPIPPYATAIRLIRVATGEVLWEHDAANLRDGSFSALRDTLAVSDGGNRVAMITWDQGAVLFDKAGKELLRQPLFDWKKRFGTSDGRTNRPALRAEISRDGTAAMFASAEVILLTSGDGSTVANIAAPGMCDARLSADAGRIFVADVDGVISCFDRQGKPLWSHPTAGASPRIAIAANGVLVAEGAGNLLLLDERGTEIRRTHLLDATAPEPADANWHALSLTGPGVYREPDTLAVLKKYGATEVARWTPGGAGANAYGRTFYPMTAAVSRSAAGRATHVAHLVYRRTSADAAAPPQITLTSGGKSRTFILDLPTPEYRTVDLPCEQLQDLTVTVNPTPGLEIAELTIYQFQPPGNNVLFVKPAGLSLDHVAGIDIGPSKPKGVDPGDVLDDKDPTQVGAAASGKMKNALIFSRNPDPDQVEGHYLRATGNALDSLDGQKFLDGKPSVWTRGESGPWGSTLVVDLNHHARPKLCLTWQRTLRQSEVMRAVVVLRAGKADMDPALGAPDKLAVEKRGIGGVFENDQFFNVFDTAGVEMDALGIFVHSGRGKDHGLSEVELFE